MAASIKFDNTEILDTTHVPRFMKHESTPEREIDSLVLARQDGEILISERYGRKTVRLSGIITGSSQADLESKIDIFKELFSRAEKNLDIDWNAGTRRYVASCTKHEFDRDHFHILFSPWTAEFAVLSGEGKDTSATTVLNEHAVTVTTPGADSFSMLGSKPAQPVITIKGNNFSAYNRGIEYKNVDTGERIIVTRSAGFNTTASIIIDCLLKKVTDNINLDPSIFRDSKFYGVFPKFKIGTNSVLITVGGIVNQQTSEPDLTLIGSYYLLNDTNRRQAQSFSVPYTDATFKGVTLALRKTGSPGSMTVRIETDNGGKPSGNLVDANATITIAAADVGAAVAYLTRYSTASDAVWSLTANTKYWIVISAAGVDGNNYYSVALLPTGYPSITAYPKGNRSSSADGGSTYTDAPNDDIVFKLRFGGQPDPTSQSIKHTVVYTKTYL